MKAVAVPRHLNEPLPGPLEEGPRAQHALRVVHREELLQASGYLRALALCFLCGKKLCLIRYSFEVYRSLASSRSPAAYLGPLRAAAAPAAPLPAAPLQRRLPETRAPYAFCLSPPGSPPAV